MFNHAVDLVLRKSLLSVTNVYFIAQEVDKHNVCVNKRESDLWAEEIDLTSRIDSKPNFPAQGAKTVPYTRRILTLNRTTNSYLFSSKVNSAL
jgi:hypothetical protein